MGDLATNSGNPISPSLNFNFANIGENVSFGKSPAKTSCFSASQSYIHVMIGRGAFDTWFLLALCLQPFDVGQFVPYAPIPAPARFRVDSLSGCRSGEQ
jgi:hypothetical protein